MTQRTYWIPASPLAVLVLISAVLWLAGCAPVSDPLDLVIKETPYYRPPTPVGDSLSIGRNAPLSTAEAQASGQPTPTVECADGLTFLSDLTIPDGTAAGPESTLDKRWEVENSGNCNWGDNYRLRLIAGPELGAQPEQALYPARSGSRAVIRIVFKAPAEPGAYRSAWQAFNPRGEPFGDPVFIDIIVE